MTEVRAARVVYQVHSTRVSDIPDAEILAAQSRHPVPCGHLEVVNVDLTDPLSSVRVDRPLQSEFAPPLLFEEFAVLQRAKRIYQVEVIEAEPEDLSYLRAAMLIAGEIGAQCEGMIVDRIALKTLYAEDIADQIDQRFDPLTHVSMHLEPDQNGLWIHTHGMEKFAHPDFELHAVPRESIPVAKRLLTHLITSVVAGGGFHHGGQAELCGFHFEFSRPGQSTSRHFSRDALVLKGFRLLGDSFGSPALEGMLACTSAQ